MKDQIKQEMLEAIRIELKEYFNVPDNWDKWDYKTHNYSFESMEEACASIAEKHIKIARLEGMIEGLKDSLEKGIFPGEIGNLEKQLEELKK